MSTVKADNFTWRTGEATAQVAPTVTGEQIVRGTCKSWTNFNGSSIAVRASLNVSSVNKNGTGDYTVNLSTALIDTNYTFWTSTRKIDDAINVSTTTLPMNSDTKTITSFRFRRIYISGTTVAAEDSAESGCGIFR